MDALEMNKNLKTNKTGAENVIGEELLEVEMLQTLDEK